MRKKIVTLLFTLCAFVTLLTTSLMCACAPESNTTGGDNTSGDDSTQSEVLAPSTFFSFTVEQSVLDAANTSATGLYVEDYMDILVTNQKMTYTSTTGSYGAYITSINGLTPSGYGYWSLLTTDTNNQWLDDYTVTISFNGLTFKTASLGASSLPAVVGESYAWYYAA